MNKLIFVVGALLGLAFCKPNIAPRVIGGELARAGQFPFQAGITARTLQGQFFCGGSLVTGQFVLTAAHCCDEAREFTIRLGTNRLNDTDDIGNPGVTIATETAHLHPDYDPLTLENDLCLIHLRMTVSFTQYLHPVLLLPQSEVYVGEVTTVVGWGQTSDTEEGYVNDLRYVDVVIISNDECRLTYGDQIKDTMVCTAGNFNEGSCIGDTGGPLVYVALGGSTYQVGVSSFFSSQGCEQIHPSGFVRLDSYIDWIENITQFEEQ